MINYANDESDKSIRKRNFYLEVFIMPIGLVVMTCAIIYWAFSRYYLTQMDMMYGFLMSITPATFLYAFKRRNWLKMPDGTYHNVKGISASPKASFNEPAQYEAEYYYSKKEKISAALLGIVVITVSIWVGFKNQKTILIPVIMNIAGVFIAYNGLKGLLDKTAKLKVAKNGLWTNKLGFVNWDDINFAEVVEDKNGKQPQLILEIRLKGTKFEEAGKPDERLLLTDLKDKESVEMVINNSINNYNEQKKQTSFI